MGSWQLGGGCFCAHTLCRRWPLPLGRWKLWIQLLPWKASLRPRSRWVLWMSESTRELEKASRDAFKAGSLMMSGKVFKAAGSSFFKSCSSQSKDSLRMALLRKKTVSLCLCSCVGTGWYKQRFQLQRNLIQQKLTEKHKNIKHFSKNVSVLFFLASVFSFYLVLFCCFLIFCFCEFIVCILLYWKDHSPSKPNQYITLITYKLITITQKYSIFNISHGSGNRTGAPIERLQPHL